MSKRNTEAMILNYFQQEPLEKAELMLKLVKDAVKKRKVVPTVKPYKMTEEKVGVQKAG